MSEKENVVLGAFDQGQGKEKISWIVLKRTTDRALILSEYALESMAFSDSGRFCVWEKSAIRRWLNGEFIKSAFSSQERSVIIPVANKNETKIVDDETQFDPDTVDTAFLLSMEEVEELLPTQKERIAQATRHAEYQGAEISNAKRYCYWWLRSGVGNWLSSKEAAWAIRVKDTGEPEQWGVQSSGLCVRPAMWVDVDKLSKLTKDDRLTSKTDLTENNHRTDEIDDNTVINIETEDGKIETTFGDFVDASAEALTDVARKALASTLGISLEDEDEEEDDVVGGFFPTANPAPSLHWRYRTQMNVYNPFAALGATMTISEEGAKFEGQLLNNDEYSAFLQKAYTLSLPIPQNYLSAKVFPVISNLFLVDSEYFDNSRDRYCEIHERMIQKIPTISALRSFAWTLAAYAEQKGQRIKNIPIETLMELADFIENRKFLNYTDKKFFTELCGHSDLFSCFVPDQVDANELARLQQTFKDAKEAYDLVESYDDLNDVDYGSLDGLRRELDELIPVMEKIHDYLLEDRDTSVQLTGTLADVLYAWCTFANCAQTAFLTEGGPRRCAFHNPRDNVYAIIQKQNGGYIPQEPRPLLNHGRNDRKSDVGEDFEKPLRQFVQEADPETLENLDDFMDALKNAQDSVQKVGAELSKLAEENERKKQEEINAELKKRAAITKTDKDTLDKTNLYIILQVEAALNKQDREDDEFYDTYDVDFPTLTKDELLNMRRGMLRHINENAASGHYEDTFRRFPFDDRYKTSTRNLYNVGMPEATDFDALARFSIEYSRHWYTKSELEHATQLIEQEVEAFRKDFMEQLQRIDPAWTAFSSANKLLYLEIEESDYYDDATHPYQQKLPGASVAVHLRSIIRETRISLYRFHGWFWGVSHKEIWEAALKNEFEDNRDKATNSKQVVQQAYRQAVKQFNAARVETITSNTPDITQGSKPFRDSKSNGYEDEEKKQSAATVRRCRRTERYHEQNQFIAGSNHRAAEQPINSEQMRLLNEWRQYYQHLTKVKQSLENTIEKNKGRFGQQAEAHRSAIAELEKVNHELKDAIHTIRNLERE